jgi:CheY-like chemotaxis protein
MQQTGEVRQRQQRNGLIFLAHRISILVVNDQPRDLVALKAALDGVECDLVTADSGHDALQCVLAQDFAVIVLDVRMPIMDGFETASLIRERQRSRSTPIIFLTAYDPDGMRIPDGYRLGAVDYIYTPVDPFVLRSKVIAFVELFRESLTKEEQAAEFSQMSGDELRRVSGRLVLAAIKGEEQAEMHSALRGEAELALTARHDFVSLTASQLHRLAMGIKTNAQLAMHELVNTTSTNEPSVQGYLQEILGSADRLLCLTDSLADVSETETGARPVPRP